MKIDKQNLKYLAELSKIELNEKSEDKLLKDIQAIFDYFEELKEVDTKNIESMSGGTIEKNVFREDEFMGAGTSRKLIDAFPEKENGFLKVPAVFE
ncbi:MAG: Asp-tRNA(Asn)/Glu-tRNA(Gln) amidotransferase subunit GatC [Patescibacteria group bacterium]